MSLAIALALFAAGWVAGVMNSVAGGGTLVTFPTLMLTGMPAISANATSTVALLTGIGSSIWAYRRELTRQQKWALRFAGPSLAGGLLGAVMLLRTDESAFRVLVPYLILFAAALFTFQAQFVRWLRIDRNENDHSRHSIAAALLFQFAVAVYGGYFGAGIGILMLAALSILGHRNIYEMNSVKVVQAMLINIIAAAYFIFRADIHWREAGLVAAGSVFGGLAGPALARRLGPRAARAFISLIGFAIGIYFLIQ